MRAVDIADLKLAKMTEEEIIESPIRCGIPEPVGQFGNPSLLDPLLDPTSPARRMSIFSAANSTGEVQKTASVMKLVAGAGTIEFGGYAYHDSTRATASAGILPQATGRARGRGAPRPPAHALRLQRRLGRWHARQLRRRARQGNPTTRRLRRARGPRSGGWCRERAADRLFPSVGLPRPAPRESRTTSTSSSKPWCLPGAQRDRALRLGPPAEPSRPGSGGAARRGHRLPPIRNLSPARRWKAYPVRTHGAWEALASKWSIEEQALPGRAVRMRVPEKAARRAA